MKAFSLPEETANEEEIDIFEYVTRVTTMNPQERAEYYTKVD